MTLCAAGVDLVPPHEIRKGNREAGSAEVTLALGRRAGRSESGRAGIAANCDGAGRRSASDGGRKEGRIGLECGLDWGWVSVFGMGIAIAGWWWVTGRRCLPRLWCAGCAAGGDVTAPRFLARKLFPRVTFVV
jgi:hypothetical protein